MNESWSIGRGFSGVKPVKSGQRMFQKFFWILYNESSVQLHISLDVYSLHSRRQLIRPIGESGLISNRSNLLPSVHN